MNWSDQFKQKRRKFGIPNLMLYILATTFVVFLSEYVFNLGLMKYLYFSRDAILSGQIWRVITFIFIPPTNSFLWILISLLFYYNISSSLESSWGTSTFTLYYLVGMLGAIIAGFITGYADNIYLNLSLMLAYVQLYPDSVFQLYFVIPVKAKYIGYVQWILYGITLIIHLYNKSWSMLGALIASLINFFIFFAPDIIKDYKRKAEIKRRQKEYRRGLRRSDDDDDDIYRY